MPKPLHKYIVLSVVCVLSVLFQFKTLNQFPQYIHSWAQCDRYALALGFIDNGGDLFHPQTYVMNNQFPGEFMIPRQTTITSVDFPVHDYVVSFIMRAADSTEPWCFRLYILLYSIVGLFFLYKLSALFTTSLTRSLFIVLFALSSPVFLYYQAGFLPTIPSLANGFIALYCFVYFLKTSSRRYFFLALLFVTLAALARLPFAILLVAMMCYSAWEGLKHRRLELFKLIGFIISIALIAAYYRYNGYLREHYGSLFLNYIIPATSLNDFAEFSKEAFSRWAFDYFDNLSWLLFAVAAAVGIFITIRNRKRLATLEKQFLFLACIILCGCCLYYLLMCYQFMNHDYYFLDTFYLPLVALFLFFVVKWPQLPVHRYIRAVSLLVFIPVFVLAKSKLGDRIALFGTGENSTAVTYDGAEVLLDSLKISPAAKLLVLGADGSNNAFILLKRKGFVIIDPEKEKIETALKWPWDYIVVNDAMMISTVYKRYPQIIQQIRRFGGNGKISVYRKHTAQSGLISDTEFFKLDKRPVVFHDQENFDTDSAQMIELRKQGILFLKMINSLDSTTEYGYTFKWKDLDALKGRRSLLKVSCHMDCDSLLRDMLICVSLKVSGKEQLFEAIDLGAENKGPGWQDYSCLFALPRVRGSDSELSVFIWNKGKNSARYDDFQVTIY